MPIVNGKMYAEGRPKLNNFATLNVLILGNQNAELESLIEQIDVLHQYLRGTAGSDISIKLHCTGAIKASDATRLGLERHEAKIETEDALISIVQEADIDIVFNQNNQFTEKFLWSKFYEIDAPHEMEGLIKSIENYLVGSGVAWSFAMPVWNMPLFMKYMSTEGLCMDYFIFMGECTLKGYTDQQKERVRYVTNKIKQVEYARDILNYYVKRMRKARRNGMDDDDYNLQLNYHLSNYYFLMAGTLDSIARLINDIYSLKLRRYADLAVEKDSFIEKNRKKRSGFVRIFKNTKFKKWVLFLKERRNFIAHDGDMRQTPLVKARETPLTESEVSAIVDAQTDWSLMATIIPPDLLQAHREQAAQIVRVQHDYEVVAEKMMNLPVEGGHKMYSPLLDIDHDYDQFANIMSKVLARLKK